MGKQGNGVLAALLTGMMLLGMGATCGCGPGGPATYPLKGKVTTKDQPVSGGSLTFVPLSDKPTADSQPVTAIVNEDGTYAAEKGAPAGKFRVLYSAPHIDSGETPVWDGKGAPPAPPKSPYAGLVPKVVEIECKAAPNELSIELVKGS